MKPSESEMDIAYWSVLGKKPKQVKLGWGTATHRWDPCICIYTVVAMINGCCAGLNDLTPI
jgi:hypothetical protein